MNGDKEGRAILNATVDTYLKQRGEMFCRGFVRFTLEVGLDTPAPVREGKPPETWRKAGQRLYGRELYEATLAAEVAARREAAHAARSVPPVRGHQGEDAGAGQAAGSGQDQRS